MNKTLVIGSTVVDVIIGLNKIPSSGEDANTTSHSMVLGGCAFNASEILRLMKSPYVLCSPVGSGPFGDFVFNSLQKKGIDPFVRSKKENGCCYCLVEEGGERTFLSNHGVEYSFSESWMNKINVNEFNAVYVCGLELEEETGINIITWLENNIHLKVYFACSSRISHIKSDILNRILNLHPILHLNEMEAHLLATILKIKDPDRKSVV